jgi:hypothetical protein
MRALPGLVAALMVASGLTLSLPPDAAMADDGLRVEKPWARAAINVARPAAAYLTVINGTDKQVTLTGASSPAAGMTMIHRTVMEGNVMKMQPAGEIVIAAGKRFVFKPGGYHIMLMHLKGPIKEGDTFPLSVQFASGKTVEVTVPVLATAATGPKP